MREERFFTAEETVADERIDKFLSAQMPEKSRSYIQKLIKEGLVEVNGKQVKANYKLGSEDEVRLQIPELEIPDILPEEIPLDILYEDEDLLVVNKQKGMVVHPAPGHYTGTLVNALMYHCRENLSGINGVMRPGIVHRIDMDTTGSLLICKNDQAHQILAEQLKEHSITRKYEAIVHGNLKEDTGTVNAPIGRHPTDWKRCVYTHLTGEQLSPTTGCWNDLEIIRTLNVNWRQAEHIRSVFIWQVSDIPFWAMLCMDQQNVRINCRVKHCMQEFLDLCIRRLVHIYSSMLRCLSISRNFCKS